ncbi:metallophosphoesterase [Patescibacteria group bacterium]|nr:metallophosphoesterase [Patescibacteria group bacterium]
MEYLILSDLHINKNDSSKKVQYLLKTIQNYKNIILNGDFYESILNTPDEIINGKFKPFIEALKAKNTYYIYGNHDPKKYSEKLALYVSKWQGRFLKLDLGKYKYHIEHGDRLHREFSLRNTAEKRFRLNITLILEHYLDFLVQIIGSNWNDIVRKNLQNDKLVKKDEILVYGHTHHKIFDLKNKIINGGFNNFGKSSFVILSENEPQLKFFNY